MIYLGCLGNGLECRWNNIVVGACCVWNKVHHVGIQQQLSYLIGCVDMERSQSSTQQMPSCDHSESGEEKGPARAC